MEIYRSSAKKAYLDVVGGNVTNVTARLRNESGTVADLSLPVTPEAADPDNPELVRHSAYIGMIHTSIEQTLNVHWSFEVDGEVGSLEVVYDVITPILSLSEIRRVSGWTDEEDVMDLERRVRYTIEAYTGQRFGKYYQTYFVSGNGTRNIQLPAPLLSVPTGSIFTGAFRAGERYLRGASRGFLDAPFDILLGRSNSGVYEVEGIWGYESVPLDVQQAARMLAVDYACDESTWRDKYMDSVRSGNWRFEFNAEAFRGTGNVVVDQILRNYRHLAMAML